MGREPLKYKPLAEAILEVRWALQAVKLQGLQSVGVSPSEVMSDGAPVVRIDPHFRLVLGRFYDRVRSEYIKHESLPSASLPDAFVGQSVQHRFRHIEGWPIVQLGPGILTVNDTEKYKWEDFQPRCIQAVNTLFEAHPDPAALTIDSLVLRYIDAVDFDHSKNDVGAFLKETMDVQCALPDAMFETPAVDRGPETFRWEASYRCSAPAGRITLLFATGARENKNAVIWETVFTTAGNDLPVIPDGFETWLEAAHNLADDWFFKLIEGGSGELSRRFNGAE